MVSELGSSLLVGGRQRVYRGFLPYFTIWVFVWFFSFMPNLLHLVFIHLGMEQKPGIFQIISQGTKTPQTSI